MALSLASRSVESKRRRASRRRQRRASNGELDASGDVAHAKPGSLRAQCSVLRLRCKRAGCRVAEYDAVSRCALWAPFALRACKLVVIGLVVINNGQHVARWRIPGVLQYFGISGLIVSAIAM